MNLSTLNIYIWETLQPDLGATLTLLNPDWMESNGVTNLSRQQERLMKCLQHCYGLRDISYIKEQLNKILYLSARQQRVVKYINECYVYIYIELVNKYK